MLIKKILSFPLPARKGMFAGGTLAGFHLLLNFSRRISLRSKLAPKRNTTHQGGVPFWRKFATQTYPAREFKSRGNPAKVFPANIPFLAGDGKFSIFSAIQGTSERSMKPFVMGRKNKRDKAGGSLTRQHGALYAVGIDAYI